MIQITASYVDGSFSSLSVTGHGGEERGRDVVCAGVSSCIVGALNALNNAENYEINVKSGDAKVVRKMPNTNHDEVVLETLIVQLSTIAKSYPRQAVIHVSGKEGI